MNTGLRIGDAWWLRGPIFMDVPLARFVIQVTGSTTPIVDQNRGLAEDGVTMNRALALWIVGLVGLIVTLEGCACEEYYCDDTGCYLCDGVSCRLVDPPDRQGCLGDYECAGTTSCTTAGCVAECVEDTECPQGTICRDGLCIGPTEPMPEPNPGSCSLTSDCMASGLVCLNGVCTPDASLCTADGDCGADERCVDGTCESTTDLCQFSFECAEGLVCVNARCVNECTAATDCATGLSCVNGFCRIPASPAECAINTDCDAATQICLDGRCIAECSTDTECATGRYCDDGRCRVDQRPAEPFCQADSDCAAGRQCVGGVCRTPCATSDECLRFDVQFNFCLNSFCATTNEATSNCDTVADCDAGDDCIDGVCR